MTIFDFSKTNKGVHVQPPLTAKQRYKANGEATFASFASVAKTKVATKEATEIAKAKEATDTLKRDSGSLTHPFMERTHFRLRREPAEIPYEKKQLLYRSIGALQLVNHLELRQGSLKKTKTSVPTSLLPLQLLPLQLLPLQKQRKQRKQRKIGPTTQRFKRPFMKLLLVGTVYRDITQALRLLSALCKTTCHFVSAISRAKATTSAFALRRVLDYDNFTQANKNKRSSKNPLTLWATEGTAAFNAPLDLVYMQQIILGLSKPGVLTQHKRLIKRCKRFTVIRSPFVYKKTREQFGLTKVGCLIKLRLNPPQQQMFMQLLCASKLPAELKITVKN